MQIGTEHTPAERQGEDVGDCCAPAGSVAPQPTPAQMGERLRAWRRSLAMTQKEAAVLLGIDEGTLRKYELGLNVPGGLFLSRVCQQGVNINWLLLGNSQMHCPEGLNRAAPSASRRISQLAAGLETLRAIEPEKYELLINGFISRCIEAIEFATLVRKVESQWGDPPPYGISKDEDPEA